MIQTQVLMRNFTRDMARKFATQERTVGKVKALSPHTSRLFQKMDEEWNVSEREFWKRQYEKYGGDPEELYHA